MNARALGGVAVALLLASPSACSIKEVTFKPIVATGGTTGAAGAAGNGGGGAAGNGGAGGAAGQDGAGGAAGAAGQGGAGGAAGAAGPGGAGGTAGVGGASGAGGARDAGAPDVHGMDAAAGHPVDAAVVDGGTRTDGSPPCPFDLVPVMTGPDTPPGGVLESGSIDPTTYAGWQVFDASSTTMWISAIGEDPAVIGYVWDYLVSQNVLSYALTYANGSILTRAPSAWTLEGLSGDTWVTVDTRTNQTGWAGFERRVFTVASPGSYPQYRLVITDDNDPTPGIVVVSLGKLELIGCPATRAP